MTVDARIQDLVGRVATEFRTVRSLIGGSPTADVSALNTSASNVVAAINELKVAVDANTAAGIDDAVTAATSVWSSAKTLNEIQAAASALVNGAPGALDTLQELAAALGNDANLASTLTNQISNVQAALQAQIATNNNRLNAHDVAIEIAGRQQGSAVWTNAQATVYADSSRAPLQDPAGTSGWRFINETAGHKINWYPYSGAGGTQTLADIKSMYAVLKFNSLQSRPFFAVYTKRQEDGNDGGSWYRSRLVYDTRVGTMQTNVPVVFYWGEDPGVYPELPRINVTAALAFNTLGPQDPSEQILTYSFGTDSSQGVGQEDFVASELGHNIGDRKFSAALVHTGPTTAEFNALSNTVSSNSAEISAVSGTDYATLFGTAVSA